MLARDLSQNKVFSFFSNLFNNFQKKVAPTTKELLSLEIVSDRIKILKINYKQMPAMVEYFCHAPLPEGAFAKEQIKEIGVIANTIRKVYKEAKIKTQNVAIAIPRELALIKNITVDSRLTGREIESRAWVEATRYFPDLVGNIHLDFSVLGKASNDPTQLEIILVVVRKDQIQPYLDILKMAGLIPKVVDINCFALERAIPLVIPPAMSTATIGLLNLNVNLSSFIVVDKQVLVHSHDQSFDGKRLLTQYETYLKTKTSSGVASNIEQDINYQNILRDSLTSHLRHSVHFFYTSKPNVAIQQLLLSGDCAVLPFIAEFIQRELNIETVIANPFKNMQSEAEINKQDILQLAPAFMQCCGLTLSQ